MGNGKGIQTIIGIIGKDVIETRQREREREKEKGGGGLERHREKTRIPRMELMPTASK